MKTTTAGLRDKLSISVCPDNLFDYFKDIADLLMNKFAISKGSDKYEIVEIEFYLFTPGHPDVITYPRVCRAGQWFFHQSGVDLTFETTNKQFGGILIRGLRKIGGDRQQIFGPLKCMEKLWDVFDAFERVPSEYPVIETHFFGECEEPSAFPRWIPLSSKKIKEAGDEQGAKRLRIRSLCKVNQELLTDLKLDKALYDVIDDATAVETVFGSCYRFVKLGAIDKEDTSWRSYAAKTKIPAGQCYSNYG